MDAKEPILNEPLLEDNYLVFEGYWYVIDGTPTTCPQRCKVKDLKESFKATEIRRCDIVARGLSAKKSERKPKKESNKESILGAQFHKLGLL